MHGQKNIKPIAVYACTVLDSWRWTENLPSTYRVLFQK